MACPDTWDPVEKLGRAGARNIRQAWRISGRPPNLMAQRNRTTTHRCRDSPVDATMGAFLESPSRVAVVSRRMTVHSGGRTWTGARAPAAGFT
jgi:hypothetical protein